MKKLLSFLFILLFCGLLLAQSESLIPNKQLMVGMYGVPPSTYTGYSISAVGKVWERHETEDYFIISSNSTIYNNSVLCVGNVDLSSPDWPSFFNFVWNEDSGAGWGLGLYKIQFDWASSMSSFSSTQPYFYLDARDGRYGGFGASYNPDTFVWFDVSEDTYKIKGSVAGDEIPIQNGQVLREWNVQEDYPSTELLNDFWSNALVVIRSDNDHPRIIWGPHPSFSTTHFKVYRALSDTRSAHPELLTYSLLATVSANTFDILDIDMTWSTLIDKYAYYYVKAYNSGSSTYSSASNIVEFAGEYAPLKQGLNNPDEVTLNNTEYKLDQNYPNPFNPSTEITFLIPSRDFVTLKVFDILGSEIEEIYSGIKGKGLHTFYFDGTNLATGNYIITLLSSSGILSRKMTLIK